MLNIESFVDACSDSGVTFYSGVPDSLLSGVNHYMCNNLVSSNHVVAVNEGAAIGLGIGHHLATGGVPLVYMQNSGLGNAINPLLSLASTDVYSIPMVLLIGWRGEPDRPDEPQHMTQGAVTIPLLEAMNISTYILSDIDTEAHETIRLAVERANRNNCPVALIVKRGTFEPYSPPLEHLGETPTPKITREQSIGCILDAISPSFVTIATTGMASRELYEFRLEKSFQENKDFLTVGGMGHAASIAYGLAVSRPDQKILCLDGDGAALMHMGSLAAVGTSKLENFTHIVLNNGCHDSVGGHPTGATGINFCSVAAACGYASTFRLSELEKIESTLISLIDAPGPHFLEILVAPGHRKNLKRPKSTPIENKKMLMEHLIGNKSKSF